MGAAYYFEEGNGFCVMFEAGDGSFVMGEEARLTDY
jgi:hypothetical protein